MAGIDGILNIVREQDATELRLGTGRVPKLFRHGAPKRFLMPETTEETLRGLLDELLTDRAEELDQHGRVAFPYAGFDVVIRLRYQSDEDDEDDGRDLDKEPVGTGLVVGFDVVFRREATGRTDDEDDFPAPVPNSAAPQVSQPAPPPAAVHTPTGPISDVSWSRHQGPVPTEVVPRVRPVPSNALVGLLARAADMGASDVHVSDDEPPTFRVDGRLRTSSADQAVKMAQLLDGCLVPSVARSLDEGVSADFSLEVETVGRFRANVYRSSSGLCAAFRVLPERIPTLADLNLPAGLRNLVDLPNGLVIVCGPTGSGKSATMAALVQQVLNDNPALLITLEDPIEYRLRPGKLGGLVRQREIGVEVRDFRTGLRDALREDPDVLLLGEMRDAETISMALTAAETGHLVISSLHSRSATSAVERIIDTYPAERQGQVRVQLADSLRAVVAQRLMPTLGGGRVPAVEILRTTHGVAALMREGKTAQISSAIQAGGADGMITLEKSLADLVRSRLVDIRVARRVANDLDGLNNYLRQR